MRVLLQLLTCFICLLFQFICFYFNMCWLACKCVYHVQVCYHRGQKRTLDHLELEFQAIMAAMQMVRNKPGSSAKVATAEPSLQLLYFYLIELNQKSLTKVTGPIPTKTIKQLIWVNKCLKRNIFFKNVSNRKKIKAVIY